MAPSIFALATIPMALWATQSTTNMDTFFTCSVECSFGDCTAFQWKDGECTRGFLKDPAKTIFNPEVTVEAYLETIELKKLKVMSTGDEIKNFEWLDLHVGKTLYGIGKQANVTTAKENCEKAGGVLAMPKLKEQVDYLVKEINEESADFWVGMEIKQQATGGPCTGYECGNLFQWMDGEEFTQFEHYSYVELDYSIRESREIRFEIENVTAVMDDTWTNRSIGSICQF